MNRRDDAGFTMIETVVAIGLVTVFMTALTMQYSINTRWVRQQNDREVAVHVAIDALNRVRSVRGTALTSQRDASSSHKQWNEATPAVAAHLAQMDEAWDAKAALGAAATAPLPTTALTTTHQSITYSSNLYVGRCYQSAVSTNAACDKVNSIGDIKMYRVVVAVTWKGQGCPAAGCSYITSTLVSDALDPIFS